MVIFHSYVSLPEGRWLMILPHEQLTRLAISKPESCHFRVRWDLRRTLLVEFIGTPWLMVPLFP